MHIRRTVMAKLLLAFLAAGAWSCGGSGGGGGGRDGGPDGRVDAAMGGDALAQADAGGDAGTGSDAGPGPDGSTPPTPECVDDGDCPGSNRGCYLGLCRDRCTPYLNPCNWKPSGNQCINGFCVECGQTSHCLGTRYTCDLATYTCVDMPFDPTITKIGLFYHTWHCPVANGNPVYDITRILAGQQSWGGYQVFHYWDEPADGYYCLSQNDTLLAKHAADIRDMGVDFVFVDVTNHAYVNGNQAPEMITQPFDRMLAVWNGIAGAPRIVPWVPVPEATTNPAVNMVDALLQKLAAYPGMQLVYQGKPLLLVTDNAWSPVSEPKILGLQETYTVRRMWALYPSPGENWSFLQSCKASPTTSEPCQQRSAVTGGQIEQVSVSMAYQANYMSNTATATPKHSGKTFRKQFETLINNPESPIVTITGWNEWMAQRQQCGVAELCDCATSPHGCFLDAWNIEYNRDIEPGKNAMGDYYVRLVKACIALFRRGDRCDSANAGDLCCQDWSE